MISSLKIIAVENVKQHAALGRIRETKTRLDGNWQAFLQYQHSPLI